MLKGALFVVCLSFAFLCVSGVSVEDAFSDLQPASPAQIRSLRSAKNPITVDMTEREGDILAATGIDMEADLGTCPPTGLAGDAGPKPKLAAQIWTKLTTAYKNTATAKDVYEIEAVIPTNIPMLAVTVGFAGEIGKKASTPNPELSIKGTLTVACVFTAGPVKASVFIRGSVSLATSSYTSYTDLLKQTVFYLINRESAEIKQSRKKAIEGFNEYIKKETATIMATGIAPKAIELAKAFRTLFATPLANALNNEGTTDATKFKELIDAHLVRPALSDNKFWSSQIASDTALAFGSVKDIVAKAMKDHDITFNDEAEAEEVAVDKAQKATGKATVSAIASLATMMSEQAAVPMTDARRITESLITLKNAKASWGTAETRMFQLRGFKISDRDEDGQAYTIHVQKQDGELWADLVQINTKLQYLLPSTERSDLLNLSPEGPVPFAHLAGLADNHLGVEFHGQYIDIPSSLNSETNFRISITKKVFFGSNQPNYASGQFKVSQCETLSGNRQKCEITLKLTGKLDSWGTLNLISMQKKPVEKYNALRQELGYAVHRTYSVLATWSNSLCTGKETDGTWSTCSPVEMENCANFAEVFKPYKCTVDPKATVGNTISDMFKPATALLSSSLYENQLLAFSQRLNELKPTTVRTISYDASIAVGASLKVGDSAGLEFSAAAGLKGSFVALDVEPTTRATAQAELDRAKSTYKSVMGNFNVELSSLFELKGEVNYKKVTTGDSKTKSLDFSFDILAKINNPFKDDKDKDKPPPTSIDWVQATTSFDFIKNTVFAIAKVHNTIKSWNCKETTNEDKAKALGFDIFMGLKNIGVQLAKEEAKVRSAQTEGTTPSDGTGAKSTTQIGLRVKFGFKGEEGSFSFDIDSLALHLVFLTKLELSVGDQAFGVGFKGSKLSEKAWNIGPAVVEALTAVAPDPNAFFASTMLSTESEFDRPSKDRLAFDLDKLKHDLRVLSRMDTRRNDDE